MVSKIVHILKNWSDAIAICPWSWLSALLMIFLRLFWNILVRWLHLTLDFHVSIITIQINFLVGWPYICPQSYFCGCWIMLILVRCLTPTPRAYCVYGRVSILLSILSKVYFQSFHPFKKGFLKGFFWLLLFVHMEV